MVRSRGLYIILFHHQTTTNCFLDIIFFVLYIILFHHQTTTRSLGVVERVLLYIILFHHQTTTGFRKNLSETCCISFYFIIKPQPSASRLRRAYVVYHSISSSNHNWKWQNTRFMEVVYHSISSSNHNAFCCPYGSQDVVYHSISSSNHNLGKIRPSVLSLYIILFHHQTTTHGGGDGMGYGCISFYFIIKPQPPRVVPRSRKRCISFYFIIKPQPSMP